MSCAGSCASGHAFRSAGSVTSGLDALGGATCGSSVPYYVLCVECLARYRTEGSTGRARGSSERDLPYARLLALAPDLLGAVGNPVGESGRERFVTRRFGPAAVGLVIFSILIRLVHSTMMIIFRW